MVSKPFLCDALRVKQLARQFLELEPSSWSRTFKFEPGKEKTEERVVALMGSLNNTFTLNLGDWPSIVIHGGRHPPSGDLVCIKVVSKRYEP